MASYVRFLQDDITKYGELVGERVFELKESFWVSVDRTGTVYERSEVQLLAPCQPSKIICVGLNYETVKDEEPPVQPLLFMKPASSLVGTGENIIKWSMVSELTFEAELAVIIGREAHFVKKEEAASYIFGYTIANDVTARDLQQTDGQWTRAKSFDTFLPLGPWVETDLSWENLRIRSWINDRLYQDGMTTQMIFDVPYLISYISQVMTLQPGDVILTGTPGGYGGLMDEGDQVEIEIQGIGKIKNRVAK